MCERQITPELKWRLRRRLQLGMASGHRTPLAYAGPSKYDAQLFIDPIIGSPLCFHVHEDVKDKGAVVEAIVVCSSPTPASRSA